MSMGDSVEHLPEQSVPCHPSAHEHRQVSSFSEAQLKQIAEQAVYDTTEE